VTEARAVHVLLVEDEPMAARAHALYISRINGFVVIGVVGTIEACVHRIRQGVVDLVLLDVHLPDGTGPDAVAAIRSTGRAVDVIIMSGRADGALALDSVAAGALRNLVKPLKFAAFRDALLDYAARKGPGPFPSG
jgi:response regulator of citrate/malate metabolism